MRKYGIGALILLLRLAKPLRYAYDDELCNACQTDDWEYLLGNAVYTNLDSLRIY